MFVHVCVGVGVSVCVCLCVCMCNIYVHEGRCVWVQFVHCLYVYTGMMHLRLSWSTMYAIIRCVLF